MKRKISEMLEEGLKDFTVRIVGSFLIAGVLFGLSVYVIEHVLCLDRMTAYKVYEGIVSVGLMISMIIFCFFLKL